MIFFFVVVLVLELFTAGAVLYTWQMWDAQMKLNQVQRKMNRNIIEQFDMVHRRMTTVGRAVESLLEHQSTVRTSVGKAPKENEQTEH